MSKYLTEFDEIQAAYRKVRLDENCMVYRNGMLLEHQDTYNKIQKLLNAPEMCEAHKYLYDLDVECLSEDEIARVDKLFDLGVKKGYIDNSFEEELEKSENPDAVVAAEEPEKVQPEQQAENPRNVPIPCWTILYSATKNGETKCGECYSNAISVSAAKADCLAKLERFGYANVSILAIEAGDADCAKMQEDDMLKGRVHNLHKPEVLDEGISEADDDEGAGDEGADDEDAGGEGDEVDSDDSGDDSNTEGEDDAADDEGSDEAGETGDDAADDGEGDEDSGSKDGEEDSGEGDEGSDSSNEEGDAEELSDEEKAALKDEYKSKFHDIMIACGFENKSFVDLTIPEKTRFFEKMNAQWEKSDPKNFMTDEETTQLESIVATPA